MNNIKKKMQEMKNEKENAIEQADQAEEKTAQLAEKLRLVSCFFALLFYGYGIKKLNSNKTQLIFSAIGREFEFGVASDQFGQGVGEDPG